MAAAWTGGAFPDRALRCAALGVTFAALGTALQLRVRRSIRSGEVLSHDARPEADDGTADREAETPSHPAIVRASRTLAWVLAAVGAGACLLAAVQGIGVGRRGPRLFLMGVAFLALAGALGLRLRVDSARREDAT